MDELGLFGEDTLPARSRASCKSQEMLGTVSWIDHVQGIYCGSGSGFLVVVGWSWMPFSRRQRWRSPSSRRRWPSGLTMSVVWQNGLVVPVFKREDQRVFSNYRGMTPLSQNFTLKCRKGGFSQLSDLRFRNSLLMPAGGSLGVCHSGLLVLCGSEEGLWPGLTVWIFHTVV